MPDLDYELKLLSRLVELDTDSDEKRNYEECSRLISDEAKRMGLGVEILDGRAVLKGDNRPRPNVIINLDKGSDTTLLLVTHYDVVPPGKGWTHDPFKLTIEGDRAYGRGAADNKGSIVTCFGALSKLIDDKTADINVRLVVTCDEEVGGEAGIEFLTGKEGIRGDAALVIDSGPEYVSCGASGVLWGKIKVKGKQGHAALPHKATNAIDEALKMISSLQEYKKKISAERKSKIPAPPNSPQKTVWRRLSVTMMRAGEKENIIPGECEVRFDLRALPDEDFDDLGSRTRKFIIGEARKKGVDAIYEVVHATPGYYTDLRHPLISSLGDAIKKITGEDLAVAADLGGNDGTFLAKVGVPVACFGPLREGTNYHGLDEYVRLGDIALTRDVIVALCQEGRRKLKKK
nr:ArgE/DapE family deacylase [Candidatus Njordarchaeota archaeon]